MTRIKNETINEFEIEKSRFICYLNRAFSESEAREYIYRLKSCIPMQHITVLLLLLESITKFSEVAMMENLAAQPEYQCWNA